MMPYKRKSIRLKNYDYSAPGMYFITICTKDRANYFEQYPQLKQIINYQWYRLPNRFNNVELDEFIIMPNHIHGIIRIVGAGLAPARITDRTPARGTPTIGKIVGAYKSICVRDWLHHIKINHLQYIGKFWQRNYYEHIIRDKISLGRIRTYIRNNRFTWDADENNPANFQ